MMDFKQSIQKSFEIADFFVQSFLADVTPEEMLLRPAPQANHIAWQLGHLIWAEHRLVEAVGARMPKLPDGFAEKHTKETAISNDPAAFLSKEEYLSLARQVRAGTLEALHALSDADFDKPVAGRVPPFVKRAGDCFVTIGVHWSTHAGQWVVVRRQLGRPRLF